MRHETAGYRVQRTNQPTLSTTTLLTETDISMTSWRLHDTELKMTKHFSIDSMSSTPNVSTQTHTNCACSRKRVRESAYEMTLGKHIA